MQELRDRLSKIEGVQHFQSAVLGAVAKTCAAHPEFAKILRENLLRQQAVLAGESTDEVRLEAFEELMHELLGAPTDK